MTDYEWVLEYRSGVSEVITQEITLWVKDSKMATFYLKDALRFSSKEAAVEYSEDNKLTYFVPRKYND